MKNDNISMPVVRRLPRYYRFLYDLMQSGVERISSKELSERMGLTASQIRQDLNCFGGFGQQGYGYLVSQLYAEMGKILGIDHQIDAILLGAGNMGRAVANQLDFPRCGMRLIGAFDVSPQIVGAYIRDVLVSPVEKLELFCEKKQPEMAILCVPDGVAPQLTKRLVSLGVRGFWNFTHYDVARQYPGTVVENVHLEDSLMTLAYRQKNG